MCGIIGCNWEDKEFIKSGLEEIKHRGPDGSGTFFDKNISLGHNRLSILDLSKAGKQPMSNEKEDIWITFNGEIYNYKEIKDNLKQQHQFKSNTDTEVILHLYEEEGVNLVNKLRGMFAFCIYDAKRKILFLARDRAGEKPLYYYQDKKNFAFASEIKALLKSTKIEKKFNKNPLSSYLTFRANTSEETFFLNIKKLLPANILIYNLKKNTFEIKEYWKIVPIKENFSKQFYIKKLRMLLEDSVKSSLMSDVPYGAYLSGGVDSGTIVSLMIKNSSLKKPIKTFSVGFDDPEFTETRESKFLAEKLGTDHHELIIKNNSVKNIPEIVHHADEPMADPTAIPVYLLSKYTKKYASVILTGEGADELFAGYPQYKFMKFNASILARTPRIIKNQIPKLIKSIPSQALNKGFKFASALGEKGIDRVSNFLNASSYSEQYLNQTAIFNEAEQKELHNYSLPIYSKFQKKYFDNVKRKEIVSACKNMDFKETLTENLLMKLDKNTMAWGVEGRVPFLDYRIIELAANIPNSLLLKGYTKDKFILREAVKNLMPRQTRKRKKSHFFVPIHNWFNEELAIAKESLLSKKNLKEQNIFNYQYINKIDNKFNKSPLFYSRQLWALLVFQIWYKRYIEDEIVLI